MIAALFAFILAALGLAHSGTHSVTGAAATTSAAHGSAPAGNFGGSSTD